MARLYVVSARDAARARSRRYATQAYRREFGPSLLSRTLMFMMDAGGKWDLEHVLDVLAWGMAAGLVTVAHILFIRWLLH